MDTRLNAVMRLRPLVANVPIAVGIIAAVACGQPERSTLAWRGATAEAQQDERTAASAGAVAPQRLWTREYPLEPASVSPDGRFVTDETHALAVRDLVSGERFPVATPAGYFTYTYAAAFSRDGRRLAYVWQSDETGERVTDVRIVDFDAAADGPPRISPPRVIRANPVRLPSRVWDFSPDGRWVLGKSYGPDNAIALELFSATGDTTLTLKTFDWRDPLRATFSPDGQFVAYDLPAESDRSVRGIFVVSLDGSRERLVVGGRALNRLFGWDPDDGILYVSQNGGPPSLWRQPMLDGRPAGAPELIREDFWRADPIGLAGRSLYYNVKVERPALHHAGADLEAARLTTPPEPVHDALGGWEIGHAWSRDGQHLAVVYRDGEQRGRRLMVRSADGREISSLTLDVEGMLVPMRWTPDGSAVILYQQDGKGRWGLHRVDLGSGSQRYKLDALSWFDWSPDGATLYYWQWREAGTIVARTLATGDERILDHIDSAGFLAVSPDGTEIATLAGHSDRNALVVSVVPIEAGPQRELLRLDAPWRQRVVEWTPDGRHVMLAARRNEAPWENGVWLLPVRGGEPRRLQGLPPEGRDARLHPSGRRIAFMMDVNRNEVWVLELGAGTRIATSPDAR